MLFERCFKYLYRISNCKVYIKYFCVGKRMQTEQLRTSNYILEDFRFNPGKITWEIRVFFNPLKSELIAQKFKIRKRFIKKIIIVATFQLFKFRYRNGKVFGKPKYRVFRNWLLRKPWQIRIYDNINMNRA